MPVGQWFSDLRANINKGVSKFQNRKFKAAAMAICARIACADGKIDDSELAEAANTISSVKELAAFDPKELYKLFEEYCGELNKNKHLGRAVCNKAIVPLKGDNESSVMALGVALAIAYADGEFQPEEVAVFKECCSLLGQDATPYLP